MKETLPAIFFKISIIARPVLEYTYKVNKMEKNLLKDAVFENNDPNEGLENSVRVRWKRTVQKK